MSKMQDLIDEIKQKQFNEEVTIGKSYQDDGINNLIEEMRITVEQVKNEHNEFVKYLENKKSLKKTQGSGIVPPLYPNKMLVNLVKLLARIYERYNSKKVRDETKRLLNMLYKSKIITNTVYNHLANI